MNLLFKSIINEFEAFGLLTVIADIHAKCLMSNFSNERLYIFLCGIWIYMYFKPKGKTFQGDPEVMFSTRTKNRT